VSHDHHSSDANPQQNSRRKLCSLEDCRVSAQWLAHRIARDSPPTLPISIGLVGTLGAGKTQWTKFFAEALGAESLDVSSPTYVLIHRYDSQPVIYHVDAYRLNDEDEFLELGIEELFDGPQITVVEWADRFRHLMPTATIWITLEPDARDPAKRWITMECHSPSIGIDLSPLRKG
jgi:tRNA threonylcarbamoyladenosine biosynthesis protein TsaE